MSLQVRVRLIRGNGLRAADRDGTSDPFVRLTLGPAHKQSKTVPNTLSPVWEETFAFEGVVLDSTAEPSLSEHLP